MEIYSGCWAGNSKWPPTAPVLAAPLWPSAGQHPDGPIPLNHQTTSPDKNTNIYVSKLKIENQPGSTQHTVYFWPKKMSSMRRILATILGAIFRFLKTKSDKTFGPWTGHWKGLIMPGVCYLNMYVSCCRRTFTFQMTGRQKTYYSNDRNHTRTNIFTPSARMTFLMRLWFMGMVSR